MTCLGNPIHLLAVEVGWQSIAAGFAAAGVFAGILGFMAVKVYRVISAAARAAAKEAADSAAAARQQADASLLKQSEGWKNLYDIERESNAQLVRTVASLQQSYDRLEAEMKNLRSEIRDSNEENNKLVALNIKHQETIRHLTHDKAGLQQALNALKGLKDEGEPPRAQT